MKNLTLALFALALVGCGSSTFECCYNKLFYACTDQTTLNACASGQVNECTRDAQRDDTCQ